MQMYLNYCSVAYYSPVSIIRQWGRYQLTTTQNGYNCAHDIFIYIYLIENVFLLIITSKNMFPRTHLSYTGFGFNVSTSTQRQAII